MCHILPVGWFQKDKGKKKTQVRASDLLGVIKSIKHSQVVAMQGILSIPSEPKEAQVDQGLQAFCYCCLFPMVNLMTCFLHCFPLYCLNNSDPFQIMYISP